MLSLSARQVCRREQGLLKRVSNLVIERQYDIVRGFSMGDGATCECIEVGNDMVLHVDMLTNCR